jgi:hypothetical protein
MIFINIAGERDQKVCVRSFAYIVKRTEDIQYLSPFKLEFSIFS